jgi:hypothetical protein
LDEVEEEGGDKATKKQDGEGGATQEDGDRKGKAKVGDDADGDEDKDTEEDKGVHQVLISLHLPSCLRVHSHNTHTRANMCTALFALSSSTTSQQCCSSRSRMRRRYHPRSSTDTPVA